MGPEVVLFAIGFYLGWFLFVVSLVLTIPRTTRNYALPIITVGTVAGAAGTMLVEWGVPWNVSFPFVFGTVAIPLGVVSGLIAMVAIGRTLRARGDAA